MRCVFLQLFQSTLPRRERRRQVIPLPCSTSFNPRSHEGSDIGDRLDFHVISSFNPRSHEGSDECYPCYFVTLYLFQSTLPRRERLLFMWYRYNRAKGVSIHAPTKGATRKGDMFSSSYDLFQSTLPRRERQQFQPKLSLHFQPKSTNNS